MTEQRGSFEGELFSFKYPAGWTVDDQKSFVDVNAPLVHPEEKGREKLTVITGTTDGLTLDQCFRKHVLDWYFDQNKDIVITSQGVMDINGRRTRWIQYQYGAKPVMTTLVFLIYSEDRFFLISTLSTAKRFAEYKDKFDGIVRTFKTK